MLPLGFTAFRVGSSTLTFSGSRRNSRRCLIVAVQSSSIIEIFMKRTFLTIAALGAFPLPLSAESGPEKDENFTHEITTDKKPWTNREFRNDPSDFQFVIVTDRTGGMRPGVFSRAVTKVNELQPEFVITVGDLIPGGGGLKDEQEIRRQWDEFNGFVNGFEMPFFYLPGNHDVSNPLMDRIWDEMYGVRYYSFQYKNVLFLCLNTQDGEGSLPVLGEEQIAWVKEEISANTDVRWTMVFIHQPLWVFEEGIPRNVNGERILKRSKTGWPEVEAALAGKKHTVYAGHVHRYAKFERNDANYYTLGTTGGGSALRGTAFGEFDHATWITMTDEGPRMMNLTLDGMLPDDVTTEAIQNFSRELSFSENFRETFPFRDKVLTLPIENPLEEPLHGQMAWILPATDHWTVTPRRLTVDLEPGEKTDIQFTINHEGDVSTYFPIPRLDVHLHGEKGGFHLERRIPLPLDLTDHVKQHPEKAIMQATETPPVIDGQLDEELWRREPTITRLVPREVEGHAPVETEAWLSYDDTSLHVAIRCHETLVRDVLSEAKERDGAVREDDSIEIFLDANHDRKTFHHFAVNPDGILYDARLADSKWNSNAQVATAKAEDSWTVELSIPLEEIDADLEGNRTWGFQMARHRPRPDRSESYQWSPTFWYGNTLPSLFGSLEVR